jgi:hypothetical protein
VFEVFAIAAVLTAAGTTAYFCIALLHQNRAISDHELTETATPLIVAAFLLVFISVFSRLPGSAERVFAILWPPSSPARPGRLGRGTQASLRS